jgi:2,5-diketo-D-gluconate reductase B
MNYLTVHGCQIPALGYGTYKLNGNHCVEAVRDAIQVGYRHIDTAVMYGNEAETGEGMRKSGIPREELFVTTKLWPDSLAPKSIRSTVAESLKYLKSDYIDLLLIHWPNPHIPLDESLGTMDELRVEGKIRFLGVSNFNIAWMEKVEETGVPVITNQVEYHVLLSQDKLLSWLRERDMFLTAYSPLAKGRLVYHPVLQEIGRKHDKTATQIALRWLVSQDGVAAVPKASSEEKRRKNFNIFDFELDPEDLERIALLEKDQRFVDLPGIAPEWD